MTKARICDNRDSKYERTEQILSFGLQERGSYSLTKELGATPNKARNGTGGRLLRRANPAKATTASFR
eukprot:scaffold946_cov168-Amphora_coffeaeformis.AAC.3